MTTVSQEEWLAIATAIVINTSGTYLRAKCTSTISAADSNNRHADNSVSGSCRGHLVTMSASDAVTLPALAVLGSFLFVFRASALLYQWRSTARPVRRLLKACSTVAFCLLAFSVGDGLIFRVCPGSSWWVRAAASGIASFVAIAGMMAYLTVFGAAVGSVIKGVLRRRELGVAIEASKEVERAGWQRLQERTGLVAIALPAVIGALICAFARLVYG